MTKRIVHALEAVEIKHQDRESLAMVTHPDQGIADPLGEQGAVGKAGQRIVARHVGKLRLRPLLRRDILVNLDPAFVTHRLTIDGNDATVTEPFDRAAVGTHDSALGPGLGILVRYAA